MPYDELTAIRQVLGKIQNISVTGLKYVREMIDEVIAQKSAENTTSPAQIADDTIEDY